MPMFYKSSLNYNIISAYQSTDIADQDLSKSLELTHTIPFKCRTMHSRACQGDCVIVWIILRDGGGEGEGAKDFCRGLCYHWGLTPRWTGWVR